MVDLAIHDPVDPIHSDSGGDIRPIAVVFAGGERGAAAPVVRVPEVGAKATYPFGRSPALVRHVEAVVGVARRAVLCPAQDRNDLAEKAISRLLARAQSVEYARPTADSARTQKAHWADVGGQSDVGLAEDRRRARDAWNRRCQVNGRKVSPPSEPGPHHLRGEHS